MPASQGFTSAERILQFLQGALAKGNLQDLLQSVAMTDGCFLVKDSLWSVNVEIISKSSEVSIVTI